MGWLDQIAAQQRREWEAKFKGPWWFYWQILSNGRIFADAPQVSILQPAAALREGEMKFRYIQPAIYRYIWLPAGFVPGSPARWALDRRPLTDLLAMKPFGYPGPTGSVVSG